MDRTEPAERIDAANEDGRREFAKHPVIWALSVALGLLFIATGGLKLIGSGHSILPGAAMGNHPASIRTAVGMVEIICGILLMIPAAATFAAVGLAIVMGAAVLSLLASADWGLIYPAAIFVALLALAWLRRPADVEAAIHDELSHEHRVLREAAIAGVLGATVIAVWFLIVDTIAGRPFQTPIHMGGALVSILGPTGRPQEPVLLVLAYTLFHYAAFFAVALAAVMIIDRARSEPTVLAGALILFVVFEIGFHGAVALLQETTTLGPLVWWQIMVGNILAALVMGTYLWRAHPELREELRHALEGT